MVCKNMKLSLGGILDEQSGWGSTVSTVTLFGVNASAITKWRPNCFGDLRETP